MDRIYCAEQIVVPPELPAIIKAYSKEVIRYQPEDLVAFSRDYFASLSQGQHKGFLAKLESEAHRELLADIERKADEAMLNPEYAEEGDLLSEPHPAVTQRGLEFAEEDAYAAQEKDAELRELVHSEEFVEFTNVVFDEASLDGDENMDPVELFNAICVLMTRMEHSYEPSAEQVMAFFKLFDEDQNNHLDREEFLRFCQQLIMYVESFAYVKEDPAASDAIAAIFAECDTQGGGPDGMLVFEEVWSAVALLNQQLPVSLRLRLDEEAVGAYIAMFRESDNGPEGLTLPAFRDMIESLIGLVAE